MESIFAISFWIIDNNITSEGTILFVHETGRNHSRSSSTSPSRAPAHRAERQGLSYTFCKPRAAFSKGGEHSTGASNGMWIMKQVPPWWVSKAPVSLIWASEDTINWAVSLRPDPQQQQPVLAPAAGVLDPTKGISQMLRDSQLTHGPVSWLRAGLFTPLVLEKEVKQPVLMYMFNSFEKPPDCRKTEQSCKVWSWFPTQKLGRMLYPSLQFGLTEGQLQHRHSQLL